MLWEEKIFGEEKQPTTFPDTKPGDPLSSLFSFLGIAPLPPLYYESVHTRSQLTIITNTWSDDKCAELGGIWFLRKWNVASSFIFILIA